MQWNLYTWKEKMKRGPSSLTKSEGKSVTKHDNI